MEVVAAAPVGGGVPPFHDHDVREWSRIDSFTGVLERARLETDHWTTNTSNSCHKYGKVVDSRARTNADGALQQQARRQLEVFQSQIPGGYQQVIKTQTLSSSRWCNKSPLLDHHQLPVKDFENLQLALNPLDLTSQKSKANVGRSVGRRPPSRPRARLEPDGNPARTAQESLQRVSRLCHQIHEDAVLKQRNNHYPNERPLDDESDISSLTSNGLNRAKSTSSEDLHDRTRGTEDLQDLEQLQSWRRTSKLRRSLQYPKQDKSSAPVDLPKNSGNVRKIREELEKGRRLSTALRGNNVDLETLDQILQSVSSCSSSDKASTTDSDQSTKKRDSFITVETLQEVKGRLRRTSSPPPTDIVPDKTEDIDDGIVTEDNTSEHTSPASRVRSYIYGLENRMNEKSHLGTGSLESRSKLLNNNTSLRNEDWHNRRKSYGFEQVHGQSEATNPIFRNNKNRIESSTDSGICRSSEIVVGRLTANGEEPTSDFNSVKQISSIFNQKDLKSTTITIPIGSNQNSNFVNLTWNDTPKDEIKRHSIAVDESKYVTHHDQDKFRRTSLAVNPLSNDLLNDISLQNRKLKRVEFCKTEVHFAAESGKVNIVETDEKPPPTHNFRRRRRNSGPLIDPNCDFDSNGLPVLHFGDTSYEKTLLGVGDSKTFNDDFNDNDYSESSVSCGTVTVNTNYNQYDIMEEEERKELTESVKGILKNKPIKPTPYHLGEEAFVNSFSDSDGEKWGVKLKPVQKSDPLFWKSTVTLHNTVYNNNEDKDDNQPEFQKLLKNLRPTGASKPDLIRNFENRNFNSYRPWSAVPDKVKPTDDNHWTENKNYSTKIRFGDGETTIVKSDSRFSSDPEPGLIWAKEEQPVKDSENKLSKGLIVKIGSQDYVPKQHQTKPSPSTTTKITIDFNNYPSNNVKLNNSPIAPKRCHSFKSTSLILDTIKHENNNKNHRIMDDDIPHKLEALKKLYEGIHTDSDSDKEVQMLMEKMEENEKRFEENHTSVVSGSWRAYKTVNELINKTNPIRDIPSFRLGAKVEKDFSSEQPKFRSQNGLSTNSMMKTDKTYKYKEYSPVAARNANFNFKSDKLSSPSLVGLSAHMDVAPMKASDSPPTKDSFHVTDTKLHQKLSTGDIVLRQPKKSEMTYFGVNVSPKPVKKPTKPVIQNENTLSEKPDLLQHMKTHHHQHSPNPVRNRSRRSSPEVVGGPIYENVPRKSRTRPDIDSDVLEELTKAADEILKAVSGIDDDRLKESSSKTTKTTMSKHTVVSSTKTKSGESQDLKKLSPQIKRSLEAKTTQLKKKSAASESTSTIKSSTKARRLQRANSREALLQSHGSSSEDLGANVEAPQRKPRQVRKTKTVQLTVSNGIEMGCKNPKPPRRTTTRKSEERSVDMTTEVVSSKTSTTSRTRTTAVKSSRDRSKTRSEEARKRVPRKDNLRETSASVKTGPKRVASSRETVNHQISTANIKKCQRSDPRPFY